MNASTMLRAAFPLALLLCLLAASPASAHVMSASQGALRLAGSEVRYELRMPLYETAALESPEDALLEAFRVRSEDGGEPAAESGSCAEEPAEAMYVCRSSFTFTQPPRAVRVRCEYHAAVAPNHVHVLRSGEAEMARRTMFDVVSPEAEIRFTAPTPAEVFRAQFGAGLRRAAVNPALALFLLALALAARTPREALAIAAAFLAVEIAAAVLYQAAARPLPARFIEAAAALTAAYLAVEILLLPEAGKRWLIAGGLGLFHGLFFGGFLLQGELRPLYFLPGAALCEAVLLAALCCIRLKARSRRAEQLAALLLLVVGLGWFLIRLQG